MTILPIPIPAIHTHDQILYTQMKNFSKSVTIGWTLATK